MPPHNRTAADTHRARRQHIIGLPVFQKLGAHIIRQPHPAEQRQQGQQDQQAGIEKRRQDNQQVQLRHPTPDFDKPLHHKVGLAAEITLHRADGHTDNRRNRRQNQREQQRIAETVHQTRQHIAPPVVRAEQMPFRRRGGVGHGIEIVQRIGGIRIGRINRAVAVRRKIAPD